jgi:hypothetical protein
LTASLRDRARLEGTTVHGALCAAFVIAGRQVSAGWRDSALRMMSPINTRPLLEVGESCGVFVNAATSTFDGQAISFWELARDAKAAIAVGQTRDGVMASLSTMGEVVGKGAEIATAANFAANAFAHEGMLTNLGVLTFGNRFGSLKTCGDRPSWLDWKADRRLVSRLLMDRFVLLTPAIRRWKDFSRRCDAS